MKLFEVAKFMFKISCFITVVFMITMWVSRFMEDEDLCLVEYRPFGAGNDIELPDASLCFRDALDEHKLNVLGTTTEAYREHLAGNSFNESLIKINYTDVIVNFGNYYNGTFVRYHNNTLENMVGGVVTTRLTTFYNGEFVRCYGINMNHSRIYDVSYANHRFIRDPLVQDFISSGEIYAVAHGPNQILLSSNVKPVSFDINGTEGADVHIAIGKAEVVKRRNKSKDPCVAKWSNWNELVLSKHYIDIGCVPTYLETHQIVPMCSTMGEFKRWSNILTTIRNQHDYLPCQQMPRIDFNLYEGDYDRNEKLMTISIRFPEQVKIITQSRAVNIDALIGNIGGYIGLFLGT